MIAKNKWVDLSILGLCTVALSGLVLRSKFVFALPFVNYNHLLEAHAHFTFGGWVTLALSTLMIYKILPAHLNKRPAYQWLLGGITISAWGMFIAFLSWGYGTVSTILSTFFIFLTYLFGYIFIRDMLTAKLRGPVLLLAVSSMICLVISSSGPFMITYILFTRSNDAILYRDALFTYLHFQYNGFFSLAIFALLFNHLDQDLTVRARKNIYRFTALLCISIIPSLFLSYLWQDPIQPFRIIATGGSLLLLLSFCLFIFSARSLITFYREEKPAIRFLVLISMGSFMLKILLQSFTIFPSIGNAVFGNRPIIMGFLHLVFLGFTSLFMLAYFAKIGLLDSTRKLTKFALLAFAASVLFNEVLLIMQGFSTMLIHSNTLFPWLLWVAAICLFTGAVLIAFARFQTRRSR